MRIKFTDKSPRRLSRGASKRILFVHAGDEYEVPANFTFGEESAFQSWMDKGYAVSLDTVVEKVKAITKRKGAKGTGPVSKGEPAEEL